MTKERIFIWYRNALRVHDPWTLDEALIIVAWLF
jgi:hypothetical protein